MNYMIRTEKFQRHPYILEVLEKDRLKKEAKEQKEALMQKKELIKMRYLEKSQRIGGNLENYTILEFSKDLDKEFYDFSDILKKARMIEGKPYFTMNRVLSAVMKIAQYYECKIDTSDMLGLHTIHKYNTTYISFCFLKSCELSMRAKLLKSNKNKELKSA